MALLNLLKRRPAPAPLSPAPSASASPAPSASPSKDRLPPSSSSSAAAAASSTLLPPPPLPAAAAETSRPSSPFRRLLRQQSGPVSPRDVPLPSQAEQPPVPQLSRQQQQQQLLPPPRLSTLQGQSPHNTSTQSLPPSRPGIGTGGAAGPGGRAAHSSPGSPEVERGAFVGGAGAAAGEPGGGAGEKSKPKRGLFTWGRKKVPLPPPAAALPKAEAENFAVRGVRVVRPPSPSPSQGLLPALPVPSPLHIPRTLSPGQSPSASPGSALSPSRPAPGGHGSSSSPSSGQEEEYPSYAYTLAYPPRMRTTSSGSSYAGSVHSSGTTTAGVFVAAARRSSTNLATAVVSPTAWRGGAEELAPQPLPQAQHRQAQEQEPAPQRPPRAPAPTQARRVSPVWAEQQGRRKSAVLAAGWRGVESGTSEESATEHSTTSASDDDEEGEDGKGDGADEQGRRTGVGRRGTITQHQHKGKGGTIVQRQPHQQRGQRRPEPLALEKGPAGRAGTSPPTPASAASAGSATVSAASTGTGKAGEVRGRDASSRGESRAADGRSPSTTPGQQVPMGTDGRPAWARAQSAQASVPTRGRRSMDSPAPGPPDSDQAGQGMGMYKQKRGSVSVGQLQLGLPHSPSHSSPSREALKSAMKKGTGEAQGVQRPASGAFPASAAGANSTTFPSATAFPSSASTASAMSASAVETDSDSSDDVPLGVRQRVLSESRALSSPSVLTKLGALNDSPETLPAALAASPLSLPATLGEYEYEPLTPPRAPGLSNTPPSSSGRSSPASSVPSSPGRMRAGAFRRASTGPGTLSLPNNQVRKPLVDLSPPPPEVLPGGRRPLVDVRRDVVPESALRAPGAEEDRSPRDAEPRPEVSPTSTVSTRRSRPATLTHTRSGSNMSVSSQRSASQGTERTPHPPSAYSPLPPPFPPPWSESPGSSAGGSVVSAKSSGSGSGSRRGPLTPRDGSDTVPPSTSPNGTTPPAVKSVAFAGVEEEEVRRHERRKSEARAAIELGNIVNGPGPELTPDDMDVPQTALPKIAPLFSAPPSSFTPPMTAPYTPTFANPMAMGNPYFLPGPAGNPYFPALGQPFLGAPVLPMPGLAVNPNLAAAHQQAMLVARQQFQYTMAQQAMAAAGEAWDLNLSVASGSMLGTPSGSVYGGGGEMQQPMVQMQSAQRPQQNRRESMMSALSGYAPPQQQQQQQQMQAQQQRNQQQMQSRMSRVVSPVQASAAPRARFAN
ncbi:hypothetical protein CALVIDRAFT_567904 [Calocera viscosa TUFC12733]|uniref:Uncharacterized protein n=1 Tax=Calocera viscosa (strain TUFC12733) TaxID=1330018 RepID=A0A167HQT9_CALVF|nr:hypothetical protein CALVIDRAFT_567904 [Calocera viscosa TUFC12733]